MNARPGTIGAIVVIVVVGFAIGAWLAIRTRVPAEQATNGTVASNALTPRPVRAVTPPPVRTLAPVATPTVFPTAATIATAVPTPQPQSTQSALTTAIPAAATTAAVANPALQGSWQLDEANVQVGAIVWRGDATPASRNTIVLTVHKQSVGGRRAMPCERQTTLRAAFSIGVTQQTVPYREVNCDGLVSTGQVHVTSFSADGASFAGTFLQNGANLGTFTARKL